MYFLQLKEVFMWLSSKRKQVTYGSAFSDYFRGFVDFAMILNKSGSLRFHSGTYFYGAAILVFIIFGSVMVW